MIPGNIFSQILNYSVMKGSNRIGSLTAKCVRADERITYSITSGVSASFIFKLNVSVCIDEIFENENLKYSYYKKSINGSETIIKTIPIQKYMYVLTDRNEETKILSSKITYTMGSMYFVEPVFYHLVYSEAYQQFVPIKEIGKNKYLIQFPDGNKSYYTYSNGICTLVEVHTAMATIQFQIIENVAYAP